MTRSSLACSQTPPTDIDGGAGNDQLGGADITVQVCPNMIFGSDPDAKNVIYGGSGDDYIAGGNGGDRIFGEEGNDCVLSEGGNDRVSVGKGADYAEGEVGDDVLIGGPGADTLNDSTPGDTDSLRGAGGSDHLDVVDNDILDTADGGPKDDTCSIDNPAPAEMDATVSCETIAN